MEDLPVVVIGAGPVGLAAAAHLRQRGIRNIVLEAGDSVGASILEWGHVRLFSPWRYNIDRAAAKLLEGWDPPDPEQLPLGRELVDRYLRPLARHLDVRLSARVVAISRVSTDKVRTRARAASPFVLRVGDEELLARAVIDASGTWRTPNPLGASGLPAIGESRVASRVLYGIPNVEHADGTTLVVGAGHSAANSILSLAAIGANVVWMTRSDDAKRVLGDGAADGLPARGKLGTDLRSLINKKAVKWISGFSIRELRDDQGKIAVLGTQRGVERAVRGIDTIIAATGQRPDLSITRELRLALDPWLECAEKLGPLIDPNEHSCGTVRPHGAIELAHPEPGFYTIGSKSYGRAPTFLLATGYEQARSVAAMIAGDRAAAMRVELDLPETGVCEVGEAGCCA
jgi:thioredoxin reductase